MRSPYAPATQLYEPLTDDSGNPILTAYHTPARIMGRVGQVSPDVYERQRMMHGRYLSGLGEEPPIGPGGEDPGYNENLLPGLEQDDDAFGSGIFDQPGSRPTANVDMGVFASEYALPGYIAREVPYAVSRDVTDVVDGGEVVFIPGGGFYHAEFDTKRQPSPVLGPTRRPPRNVPAPLSTIAQPIVTVQPEWAAQAPLNALAPVRPFPAYRPEREVPSLITNLRTSPSSEAMRNYPVAHPLPYRQIVRAVGQTEEKPPASAGTLAFYGLLLGASVGLVVGALKAKPGLARANTRRNRRRSRRAR